MAESFLSLEFEFKSFYTTVNIFARSIALSGGETSMPSFALTAIASITSCWFLHVGVKILLYSVAPKLSSS